MHQSFVTTASHLRGIAGIIFSFHSSQPYYNITPALWGQTDVYSPPPPPPPQQHEAKLHQNKHGVGILRIHYFGTKF